MGVPLIKSKSIQRKQSEMKSEGGDEKNIPVFGSVIDTPTYAFKTFYGMNFTDFSSAREACSRSRIFLFSLVYVCMYVCVSRFLAKRNTIQT